MNAFSTDTLHRAAQRWSTPLYAYDIEGIKDAFLQYYTAANCTVLTSQNATAPAALVAYAVKANANLSILQQLSQWGAGFDIVSGGELQRVLAAGGDPQKVVFSGVGKTTEELTLALNANIKCFNVESVAELTLLNTVAHTLGKKAAVSLRINPDIDAGTHPYISTGLADNKFGISYDEALASYGYAASLENLDVVGIDCHIGSQISSEAPLLEAVDRILTLYEALREKNITIKHIDVGGGVGIRYHNENVIDVASYVRAVRTKIAEKAPHVEVLFEPGRSIVGPYGVLVTKVLLMKTQGVKNFLVVDAAMNDLIRPALYQAYHRIEPLVAREGATQTFDVVGPICESADVFAYDYKMTGVEVGDYLIMHHAGAYGSTMASNYNARARAAEVLIDGSGERLIRSREDMAHVLYDEQKHLIDK